MWWAVGVNLTIVAGPAMIVLQESFLLLGALSSCLFPSGGAAG